MVNRSSHTYLSSASITLSEAEWLTELPAKMINAVIDRGEIPRARANRKDTARREARILSHADVVYLALRHKLGSLLSASAKSELYEGLASLDLVGREMKTERHTQADLEIALAGGMIRIDMKETNNRLQKRWLALRNAEKFVVSDQDIRGGEPVIRNTRVPVYLIADLIKQGAALDELLEDYPSLNAARIRAAVVYAEAHPRRGRPRKAPWK